GVGIDAEDVPRLFQRYFRARTSTGIAGTGIGLNLVKQIVELHSGSIEVRSARGCGSTFTVTLPIKRSGNASASSDAA
ncbi:sensor histidine kinase, partial [Rhizobium ruizarguesonis]